MYIDEIQACVHSHLGILASRQCIKQALDSLHISHKQVSKIALERNELLCAAYMCHYANLVHTPDMLMCIDEGSKDERTVAWRWGYARPGKWCPSRQHFIWGTWYTILPVLGIDGYLACEVFEGAVTREMFLQFLQEHVVGFSFFHLLHTSNWCFTSGPTHVPLPWTPEHAAAW